MHFHSRKCIWNKAAKWLQFCLGLNVLSHSVIMVWQQSLHIRNMHTRRLLHNQVQFLEIEWVFTGILWFKHPHKSGKLQTLTHWGRVTHICVSKLSIIGSDNGLSPGQHQTNNWINPGTLLIWPSVINFGETLIEIHISSVKKIHLKMYSAKCRLFYRNLFARSR